MHVTEKVWEIVYAIMKMILTSESGAHLKY